MKVHGNDPVSRLRLLLEQASGVASRPEAAPSASLRSDRVEVSSAAREFHAVRQAVLSLPETRIDLVESLRQRIESGSYEPDVRAVAQRMLEELGDGLGES